MQLVKYRLFRAHVLQLPDRSDLGEERLLGQSPALISPHAFIQPRPRVGPLAVGNAASDPKRGSCFLM